METNIYEMSVYELKQYLDELYQAPQHLQKLVLKAIDEDDEKERDKWLSALVHIPGRIRLVETRIAELEGSRA